MASNSSDELALAAGFGMAGVIVGMILAGFVDAIITDDKTSEYRKHMIRNDVAEWVINEDGNTVFTLKGKQ